MQLVAERPSTTKIRAKLNYIIDTGTPPVRYIDWPEMAGKEIPPTYREHEVTIHDGRPLRDTFRPEFRNRVDEVVIFQRLSREQLTDIVELQAGGLRGRLASRRIELELTDEAKRVLVDHGYDPAYGARPLKRTVQRELENPLAMMVLQGEVGEGDTVVVDAAGDELDIAVRRSAVAAA